VSAYQAESVTREDFDGFLCRFGSMNSCIGRVCRSLFDAHGILYPWYHGKADKTECSKVVKLAGDKAFLVRLSDKDPVCISSLFHSLDLFDSQTVFVITYMSMSKGGVQNSYIYAL
jgi:hypothetical protein